MELDIVPLAGRHDRGSFDCGEASLNAYLQRYAGQDVRRRVSRVFVATPADSQSRVVGYYGLNAGSLDAAELPDRLRRRLPRYPVPVAVLGRLAVDISQQGRGLGAVLLADALKRVAQAAQVVAIHAVVVDALDARALGFYRRFGFIALPSQPFKLFLPLDTVNALLD